LLIWLSACTTLGQLLSELAELDAYKQAKFSQRV
jgi:hypothetical protein